MRDNIIKRVIRNIICLVLFVAIIMTGKQVVIAAEPVELQNPTKDISCDNSTIYTATFYVNTELIFSSSYGSSTPVTSYIYKDSECTELISEEQWCDEWDNQKFMITLEAGTYYFKFAGYPHNVSVLWAEADVNRSLDTALPISISEGTEEIFDLGKSGEFWWILNVPTTGKYTFKTNSAMSLYLMRGKESDTNKSLFDSASHALREKETLFLTQGEYTVVGRSGSNFVNFTVTNNSYTELTSMGGDAKVLMGARSSVTYTLSLTPSVNDAEISATAELSAPFIVTKVNKNTYVFESSSYATGKGKVTFKSNDGITKVVDVWIGPVAAKVTSEGTHNSTTLKMLTDAAYKPQYVIYQLAGNVYNKIGTTSGESFTVKNLKPNGEYTFKVVACDGDIEGGATIHKAITASNKKVTGISLKCTGCKYYKGRKPTWEYSKFSGWYKVSHPARSYASVKVKYKKPKGSSYVLVDGKKIKSGKKASLSYYGKVRAGKKGTISFRPVREISGSIAYGPTVSKKVKLKGAK